MLPSLVALLALGCKSDAHPEGLVLVNRESPISIAIGDFYAKKRGIPERNVLSLSIPLSFAAFSLLLWK